MEKKCRLKFISDAFSSGHSSQSSNTCIKAFVNRYTELDTHTETDGRRERDREWVACIRDGNSICHCIGQTLLLFIVYTNCILFLC